MSYTPGPWQQNGSHLYGPDPKRRLVCQIHYQGISEDNHNARLIAAAPDLLEACKAARDRMWAYQSLSTRSAAEACDAAIRKAESNG